MDPPSITTACLGLTGTIIKVYASVAGFVRDVRSARQELDEVLRELQSLQLVLELLRDDTSQDGGIQLPSSLTRQVTGIVANCTVVVEELETLIDKHKTGGINKAARWALTGRGDANKLRSSLEAHKSALELALDLIALYVVIMSLDSSHS
jgi:hypothetical protein